jgi:hypothetical protein
LLGWSGRLARLVAFDTATHDRRNGSNRYLDPGRRRQWERVGTDNYDDSRRESNGLARTSIGAFVARRIILEGQALIKT